MFTLNAVTLRPLELDDMDSVYMWFADIETGIWGGWTPVIEKPLSRHAFRLLFDQHFVQTKDDQVMLGIEFENQLIGFIQLIMIGLRTKRAEMGICIGEKHLRGRGIGSTAVRLLLDYAFTVKGLERVYAEVFSSNHRSQRLMEYIGFQREGLLRQHDFHNGVRQDVYIFGILRAEFYQKYDTVFKLEPSSD